jgi:hypothetical protein
MPAIINDLQPHQVLPVRIQISGCHVLIYAAARWGSCDRP